MDLGVDIVGVYFIDRIEQVGSEKSIKVEDNNVRAYSESNHAISILVVRFYSLLQSPFPQNRQTERATLFWRIHRFIFHRFA